MSETGEIHRSRLAEPAHQSHSRGSVSWPQVEVSPWCLLGGTHDPGELEAVSDSATRSPYPCSVPLSYIRIERDAVVVRRWPKTRTTIAAE